jgi:RNA polymerase sigma-70 factor (ECF subfamily)
MNGPPGFIASLFCPRDEEAMQRLQTRNDHQAFAQLVERWERPILGLCAKMTGDLSRAEDLKQEAFTRVFTKRQSFQPGMRFSTWLWRIALNLCFDELRRTRRRAESSLEAVGDGAELFVANLPAEEAAPDVQTAMSEESELVRAGLLQLPETLRAVLVLRFCEELKLREVAEILALPESTVRYRLGEGLTRMTRLLEPSFGRSAQGCDAAKV